MTRGVYVPDYERYPSWCSDSSSTKTVVDASTQTDASDLIVVPSCDVGKRCRWKRTKKNMAKFCICNDDYCRCCPNGCYFAALVNAYPDFSHEAKFDHLCGVCKSCISKK